MRIKSTNLNQSVRLLLSKQRLVSEKAVKWSGNGSIYSFFSIDIKLLPSEMKYFF